ncbi:hypothetical protein [Arthrobacter luteolus]|uniref:hypothetical protein n=1 Tax=Arthrobacter luteolus TaxID=98672 RepID=UPI001376222D|nr:hypothetical protein [Arthrobacter luteolus]
MLSITPTNGGYEVVYMTNQGLKRERVESKEAAHAFIRALPNDDVSDRFMQRRNSVETKAKKLEQDRSKSIQLRAVALSLLSVLAASLALFTGAQLLESSELTVTTALALGVSLLALIITNFTSLLQARALRREAQNAARQEDFLWAVRAWAATSADMPIEVRLSHRKDRTTADMRDRDLEKI